jgi:hypothetical protein
MAVVRLYYAFATAIVVAAYAFGGIASRLLRFLRPIDLPAATDALRIGVLGAAKVNRFGILLPARALSEVTIVAIGARDVARAKQLAQSWGVSKYGDYDAVLTDPDVEAVYVPLLNGLHYKWAAAALRAGKHVLLEKPLTANADEARALVKLAHSRKLVLFEAYHWAYHPLAARMREVLRSGELGQLVELEITAGIPSAGALLEALGWRARTRDPSSKMDVSLGGGKFLGQGCYAISAARYLLGEPVRSHRTPHARKVAALGPLQAHLPSIHDPAHTHSSTACPRSNCSTPQWMRICPAHAPTLAPVPQSSFLAVLWRSWFIPLWPPASTLLRAAPVVVCMCLTTGLPSFTTASASPPPMVVRRALSGSTAAAKVTSSCSSAPLLAL